MLILLETMAETHRHCAGAAGAADGRLAGGSGGAGGAATARERRCTAWPYPYLKNQHDAKGCDPGRLRAWENAHQYRPQGTPLAWLLSHRPQPRPNDTGAGHGSGGLGTAGSGEPDGDVEDRQVLERRPSTALADDERQIVLLHAVTG